MKEEIRNLEGQGESDYDFVNDILFFKVKDRSYERSLEFDNIVIDLDTEDFITGIQIFDASEFLSMGKNELKAISRWKFRASMTPGRIEVRVFFQIIKRNKTIEKNPIIVEHTHLKLPRSEVMCEIT